MGVTACRRVGKHIGASAYRSVKERQPVENEHEYDLGINNYADTPRRPYAHTPIRFPRRRYVSPAVPRVLVQFYAFGGPISRLPDLFVTVTGNLCQI